MMCLFPLYSTTTELNAAGDWFPYNSPVKHTDYIYFTYKLFTNGTYAARKWILNPLFLLCRKAHFVYYSFAQLFVFKERCIKLKKKEVKDSISQLTLPCAVESYNF